MSKKKSYLGDGVFSAHDVSGSQNFKHNAIKFRKPASNGVSSPFQTKIKVLIVAIIFFIFFITILTGGISQSQLNKTYYLTAIYEDNGMNKPEENEKENSIWKKETAIQESEKLMQIVTEVKAEDKEFKKESIKNKCLSNGWDVTESMAHLREESSITFIPAVSNIDETSLEENKLDPAGEKEERGEIIQTFDISNASSLNLSKFFWESINQNWTYKQKEIYDSKSWYVDAYGLCKYKNEDGTEDYMVALGSYFGDTGNRYRITFKNGTVATFLKFDAKAAEDTINKAGLIGNNGGILEFIVDPRQLNKQIKASGDVKNHPKRIFDQITKIELIEGSLSSNFMQSAAISDCRVLAAYSVAIDNVELTKVDGMFGGFFQHVGEKYVNEKGLEINVEWFGENAGKINYEKDLKKRLEKFLDKGGSFYEIDYEKENGKIKVYSKSVTIDVSEKDDHTGTNITKKKTSIVSYVVPILKEKDINNIAEELFDLDPNGVYTNDDGSKVQNREVIDSVAEYTNALLYDIDGSFSGGIMLSDLSGKFAWPVPGCIYITSRFGYRSQPGPGASTYHEGIDIGCSSGTPVVAASDGTIILAGWYGGYGNCIKIQHDNKVVSLYGHLLSIGVKNGQKIKKGQQIALSGNTGTSYGAHLHFGIYIGDTAVDPTGYVLNEESYKKIIFTD